MNNDIKEKLNNIRYENKDELIGKLRSEYAKTQIEKRKKQKMIFRFASAAAVVVMCFSIGLIVLLPKNNGGNITANVDSSSQSSEISNTELIQSDSANTSVDEGNVEIDIDNTVTPIKSLSICVAKSVTDIQHISAGPNRKFCVFKIESDNAGYNFDEKLPTLSFDGGTGRFESVLSTRLSDVTDFDGKTFNGTLFLAFSIDSDIVKNANLTFYDGIKQYKCEFDSKEVIIANDYDIAKLSE